MLVAITLVLFSLILFCFYMALSQGTELPSSVILSSFTRKKQQKMSDLTNLFTDQGLIYNRLDDLVKWKLVERRDRKLMLTVRGRLVWRIMEAYRWVFARSITE